MKRRHHEPNRRDFLKLAGASALAAGMAQGPLAAAQEEEVIKSTVSITRDPSIAKAVREAVELSGGLDFIEPGQKVLIKPNQTAPILHPAVTNPEVLYEVVKLVAEADAGTIFVSDRCFQTFNDGMMVMKRSGHYDAVKQAEVDVGGGATVIPVAFHEAQEYLPNGSELWRGVYHPQAENWVGSNGKAVPFRLAELLFQVDHVINVPCCKVHNQVWLTMSMKNFVGMSDPATTRRFFHMRGHRNVEHAEWGKMRGAGPFYMTEADATPISRMIAEMNLGLTPALNIIDATQPIYAGGHIDGESVKADTIIASRDRIAADVTGIALLRTLGAEKRLHSVSPWKVPLIRHARKIGLGVTRLEDMTVKHSGIDNFDELMNEMA